MSYKRNKQYRLYGYDYSLNGAYHITIVTKNRVHYFGEIENGVMNHTAIGQYAIDNIEKIQEVKKDLVINEWEVLPNHIHFIITINSEKSDYNFPAGIQPLIKQSISAFINHFKGYIKRWCNDNGAGSFEWQARFHDHIIRNEEAYFNVARYIQNNIANWKAMRKMKFDFFGRNTPNGVF